MHVCTVYRDEFMEREVYGLTLTTTSNEHHICVTRSFSPPALANDGMVLFTADMVNVT